MIALINKQTVILHKTNDALSEPVDENLYGYEVEVLEQLENGFSKVRTHYGYEGFIENSNLLFDKQKIDEFKNAKQMVVNHTAVDVRNMSKVQGVTLLTLTKGCLVTVYEENDGWVQTKLADGRIGYIRGGFLSPFIEVQKFSDFTSEQVEKFRENVVKTAFEYMTTQYKWGGKSPLGIDCSGLCSIVYLLNGVIIYRDAIIVDGYPVKEIKKEDLKIGDFIYFPRHVAMYIGNNEYIHSSAQNDGVYINSLDKTSEKYREDLATTITMYGSIF